ncbi:MAG: hypothetical protein AAF585_08055 [Verrucomicrobiota bacterium]
MIQSAIVESFERSFGLYQDLIESIEEGALSRSFRSYGLTRWVCSCGVSLARVNSKQRITGRSFGIFVD